MKNRKSYSRCPALLAVLTVCSTVLFLFSSCGSGNGKPSSVGSDDPADTYRGYLSEIRRLDHLTAKELAGHLKRWQTVKDSVFARLRRDTLGLPGSDACKVCEGIHDSLRIEFSRLALSGPRTYGELLMLKERLSPYAADEELRRAAETVRPFFASLDGHPACRDDRRQVLSTYRALLAESIRDGIHSRDDLTAYIAREDAVFRGFLTHLHELGSSDVADIACDTERCCSQVFLAAGRGEIAWRDAMLFLAMRTGRRLIQNAHTCIDDIRNRRAAAGVCLHLDASPALCFHGRPLPRAALSARARAPRRDRRADLGRVRGVGLNSAIDGRPTRRIARNAHGGIYSHAVNLIRNEYATTLL